MPLNSNWPVSVEKTFGKNSSLVLNAVRLQPQCHKKFRTLFNQYKLSLEDTTIDRTISDSIVEELQKLLIKLMQDIKTSYPKKIQETLYAQANIRLTGDDDDYYFYYYYDHIILECWKNRLPRPAPPCPAMPRPAPPS